MNKCKNVLVVLNYNDAATTKTFVEMACDIDAIDKIVIVDNCSTDDSFERLSELVSEKINVIKTARNGGYAFGNNEGCKYAIELYNPDVLFISNPDVRFNGDTVIELQKVLDQVSDAGVVAPIVNQGYNLWRIPGYCGTLESIFLVIFNLDKRRIKKKVSNSSNKYEKVGVVEGSFFCIRTEAYKAIEGFDTNTFLYYEENILARRLLEKGYYEYVSVNSRYDHFHSVSIKKRYGTKTRAFKNFHPSMHYYLDEYLHCDVCRRLLFELFYGIGYLERMVYDLIRSINGK